MKRSSHPLLILAVALTVAVLLGNGLLAYRNAERLIDHERWVAHTHEVLTQLEGLLSTVKDAETGQRGFLITGEEKYLEPHQAALQEIQDQLQRLRNLTADNPDQQTRLAALEEPIHQKLGELQRTIDLRRTGGFEAARAVVQTNRGMALMKEIREQVAAAEDVEQRLLAERAGEAERSAQVLIEAFVALTIVGLALLILSVYLSQRISRARQRAAEQVRQQREWLEVTLRSIGDGVIATDARGRVAFLNPVAETLTGWSPKEAAGLPLDHVFPIRNEQTGLPVENPVAKVLHLGMVVGLANHTILRHRNGEEHPIEDSAAPIRDERGQIQGVVLVFRDVRAKRQAEQERELLLERERAARASAEHQRDFAQRILDFAPIPIGVLQGPEHRVVVANAATLALTRLSREQVIGQRHAQVVPEADQVVAPILDRVYRSGNPETHPDMQIRMPDGRTVHLHVTFTPLPGSNGDSPSVMYLTLDRTQEHWAEQERQRLLEEAQTASQRKDEFLAMLGHELRNPLAPIRIAVHLLRQKCDGDAELDRLGSMIERQLAHVVRLLDDLLDIARITRGRLELRPEVVEVTPLIQRVVETMTPLVQAHRHHLEVQLPEERLLLEGDGARLEQVLANLVSNAAKYTDPGGRISLTVAREGPEVVIRVRDTGIGVPAEKQEEIFELFQQGDRVAGRVSEGLGVGLALVQQLVQMHGGTVTVHSAGAGQGSEFEVRLPLSTRELPASASEPVPSSAKVSRRILVVDDNRDAAESLAMILRLEGHQVQVAYDGPAALKIAEEIAPEIVLLDIGLPRGMNGYEVARRLRATPSLQHTRLVALTGYGQEEDRQRAEAAGFEAHVVKPIAPDVLRHLLTQVSG